MEKTQTANDDPRGGRNRRLLVTLPPHEYDAITETARRLRQSRAEVMRQAMRAGLRTVGRRA